MLPATRRRPILTLAYVALTVVGCGYVLLSLFLGHGHDAADGGGGHVGHDLGHGGHAESHVDYGVQGGGHGTSATGHAGAPTFHFPFFSPLALATLFGAIGAFGLIARHGLGAEGGTSLLLAIPAAVITAYAVTYVGWKLVTGSLGSSQIRLADLEGALGEVITPIPVGGLGEVAAMVDGQRFTGPAREVDGKAVARGASVRVRAMVGGTLVVISETRQ